MSIPVDMHRILLTHSHSRTVHNDTRTFQCQLVWEVGTGKCSKKLTNNGSVQAAYGKLNRDIGIGTQTSGYVPYLDHINTMRNTFKPSNASWSTMVEARKYLSERAKHVPIGAARLPMKSFIAIFGAHNDGYAPYLVVAPTLTYCAQLHQNFQIPAGLGWLELVNVPQRAKHGPVGAGCLW